MKFMMVGKLKGRGIVNPEERTALCTQKISALEIRLLQRYLTAGAYDFCTLIDAPNLAMATAFNLWWIGQGFGQSELLQVFEEDEFAAITALMRNPPEGRADAG
ncbi:MAG TPA: GYD domain-containing protein [Steroidobacteraceae bacterium]|nr:GYD domain-containing protein [Steroidobacteraceae bacterium]